MKQAFKIKDLKDGDIFTLGGNVWDAPYRFIKIGYFDYVKNTWVDQPNKKTRSCVFLSNPYTGDNDGCSAWWDENTVVYIPKYPMSTFKKSIGKQVILHPNGHLWHILPYQLNEINIEP